MFDCLPSDISEVYWKCTLNDIKVKLRLYLGQQQAHVVQNYQTLATIVSEAFGGGTGKKGPDMKDVVVPQTQAEMHAAFKSVFG